MTDPSVLRAAFDDELLKIAGELQGFTRIGRRPISVDRLLERESASDVSPSDVVGTTKESSAANNVALLGLGALGFHVLHKANQDRILGKQVRLQSKHNGY